MKQFTYYQFDDEDETLICIEEAYNLLRNFTSNTDNKYIKSLNKITRKDFFQEQDIINVCEFFDILAGRVRKASNRNSSEVFESILKCADNAETVARELSDYFYISLGYLSEKSS